MKVLVTGSAGHLGEALAIRLTQQGYEVTGLDIKESPYTTLVGSIADRAIAQEGVRGATSILHTATLHKPHVGTHNHQQFIDTNITGTLNLLQEAVAAGAQQFIFTSTTSVFGDALVPPPGKPAAWITEEARAIPKNIYGVTKSAAEDLCQLYYRNHGLPCIVLRTSRFFPEADDNGAMRNGYADANLKLNEYLFRRVDIEDAVTAHLAAMEKAAEIRFGKFIISATTPFTRQQLQQLRADAPAVLSQLVPGYEKIYDQFGWKMFPGIDRVYVNTLAREVLGWQPVYDFAKVLAGVQQHGDTRSPMAAAIGCKGYHTETFEEGPYPL